MTAYARAARITTTVTEDGPGRRVTLSCPCLAVGIYALKFEVLEDVVEELRRRHREQRPPTCHHREVVAHGPISSQRWELPR